MFFRVRVSIFEKGRRYLVSGMIIGRQRPIALRAGYSNLGFNRSFNGTSSESVADTESIRSEVSIKGPALGALVREPEDANFQSRAPRFRTNQATN